MPCTFTGSFEGDKVMSLREDLDELTQLLCSIGKTIEKYSDAPDHEPAFMDIKLFSPKVRKWLKEHKKLDSKKGKK